jgi:hypothetical protein
VTTVLQALVADPDRARGLLPSGSGIDLGCTARVWGRRVLIDVPYHAMDAHGYYCGWAQFRVAASLDGGWPAVRYLGGNDEVIDHEGRSARRLWREHTAEYLAELFDHVLTSEAPNE